ncbi:hypothetical protein P1X14_00390 [Sphingomonas sp. AOB5]|uniref:hypothetical protein n=1 Tax=Sphingomonas sp. AOB5 TaxID=3034017 RepID=UPI0023F89BDC|nr:hypothetical protein [Sphingomonas sp. AOB5]MDF7773689.1 hypothetical protein [Sphingomonas sp. AOB5]
MRTLFLILFAALLLPGTAWAQDAGAVDEEQGEEIVVRATFGRTTMLFDKTADGKLRNCRVMVSSGSQKRDSDACKATPVCYEKTRDEVSDCVELTALEQAAIVIPPPVETGKDDSGVQTFTMPALVKPVAPVSPTAIGPITNESVSRDTERQRVTLPPLPKAPSSGPAITLSNGQETPR